jgi:hypothetical protein
MSMSMWMSLWRAARCCTSDLAFCSDAGVAANRRQKQEWALAGFSGGGAPQHYTTYSYRVDSHTYDRCLGGEHGTKENTARKAT